MGRYVLLDQLGTGAMGVVYSAYDPELDRKLALKLLHPGSSSREAKATRNRLRREAQALARLTHPNVVAVHDVGTHAGRVFVAMEFVAGRTLRQWVRADPLEPQPVSAIIEVFTAAGRGLAAAHRAGLVHRDFKPENVLIGDDGLVRVVDFGLARRSAEDEFGEDSIDSSGTHSMDADVYESIASIASIATHSLDMSLTGTGRVMGTPAYMAPEQHVGEVATVRSDQFAFCVALWEALYGARPFPGRDLPSLSLAVTSGLLSDPPTDGPNAHHRVPAHVHRAIVRGLSTDPDLRFSKIDDLLVALTHDPNRRRRKIARIVGINLLGAMGVFAAGMWVADSFGESDAAPPACDPVEILDGIWGPKQHGLVAERFALIDAPFAEHSAREVERRLDAYTSQWLLAWGETCEAEASGGSSGVVELQRECLELRRRELQAFSAALISTSTEEFRSRAEHAVAAAESLPPISTCRDPSRLRADPHLNPKQRERVASLQTSLSEARTLGRLGDRPTGLAQARDVVEAARELDSQRMLIRALLVVGELEQQANELDAAAEHVGEAYTIAEQQGEDWLRADAATRMIGLLGFHLQRPGEAAVWEQVADSLLVRVGEPQDLRGNWYYEVGTTRMRQTEFAAAEQALNRALEVYELVHGHDSREIERVLQRLGAVARERGDYERAVSYHTRLLSRRIAVYGPDHPDVAAVRGSLGNDFYFRGDYREARTHYEQALRIIGECYGEDSPAYTPKLNNYAAVLERLGELDEAEAIQRKLLAGNIALFGERDVRVSTSLENLGLVLISAGRFDEAEQMFRRSLAIRSAHHGDQHVATATSKLNLGYALYYKGEYAAARKLYEQTLMTWVAKLGEDHPDLALVYGNVGDLDLEEGRLADAKRNFERAFELIAEALGEDAADLGYNLTGLARVAVGEGEFDEAIELCERALDVRDGTWLPPGDLGLTQLTLSRALIARGGVEDRSRARDLALLAREDFRRGRDEKRSQEVLAWLASLE
ncbi:High-affnity carbon uptake protein Hat/HatR [Enhygromyxa salina]|uniref:High-affnity carbon uptake protein Hat/HatR n=1 Tax=Enhygromyxa salina TaxID=215803 RepID=A0A0C2D8H3_9BACT|nr:High-affnity carbon uptake protein Hat/HatR [Enhygromyxa salina]